MADQKNILPATGLDFSTVDIESPLKDTNSRTYDDLLSNFANARSKSDKEGRSLEAKAFESLVILSGFRLNFYDRSNPYSPIISQGDKRSAIPSDLTIADLDAVFVFWERSTHPLLRARLGDILFIRRKNHKAAQNAVTQYINAGNSILDTDDWVHCAGLFKRGLQLAGFLGRGNEFWKKAEVALLNALKSPQASVHKFYACKLLKVAAEFSLGEPIALAENAREHAQKATVEKDYRREREYLLLEAAFLSRAGKNNDAAKIRLSIAETYDVT